MSKWIPLVALTLVVAVSVALAQPGPASQTATATASSTAPAPQAATAVAAAVAAPAVLPAAASDGLLANLGQIESLMAGARWDPKREVYVAPLKDGREAELTLDRTLQTEMEQLLASYQIPQAAVVAIDPRDGRVLALAEYAHHDDARGLALKAIYPAASVFKIVTASALLEAGIQPTHEVCFHGGMHRIDAKVLKDDPRRDRRCETLSTALGKSLNVVFGKLAQRTLQPDALRQMAGRYFFNQPLPVFPAPTSVADAILSKAIIPEDELDFGRTAAGFGQVYLSPLHGAVLAGAVGNGGVAVEPHLVDAVVKNGVRVTAPPGRQQRVVSEQTAVTLTRMMTRTVTEGTARKAFRMGRRWALGDVQAAGKTGSLSDHQPFKDYSWFVGFAPTEDPTIAVGVVVVNSLRWRVKAPLIAREALRIHFSTENVRRHRASRL